MPRLLLPLLLLGGTLSVNGMAARACHPEPGIGCPHGCIEGQGLCCPPLPDIRCRLLP